MTEYRNTMEEQPTYATSNYLYWLNPDLDKERHDRQEEIHRKMSQMLVESYWRQIGYNREKFWREFNGED